MAFDSSFMIDIDDGRLVSGRQELADAFAAARQSGKPIVMHFHGGLIQRNNAIGSSTNAKAFYDKADAISMFPVWRTGVFETLGDIWLQIAKEQLFKIVVDRVSGWAHGQISNVISDTRAGNPTRTLPKVTEEVMAESGAGDGDFPPDFLKINMDEAKGRDDLALTAFEEKAIIAALSKDTELKLEIDAVLQSISPTSDEGTRDLEGLAPQPPKKSLADPAALAQMAADRDTRSLGFGTAVKILKIVKEVIFRYMKGKDHGFHATVVEEVLRAFYLGSIGTSVWEDIKNDAVSAFNDGAEWAGTAIIEEIAKVPQNQRVMLVGHSAGAIFIAELMKRANKLGRSIDIVFLAPAVRCKPFVEGVVNNPDKVSNFRMYTMSDENEAKDTLIRGLPVIGDVPWFYPRSLLYLVSGLFERDGVDSDILGMERFHHENRWNATDQFVQSAREYCKQGTNRTCFAVKAGDDLKLRTNSLSHGGFGTPGVDNQTMDSVSHILKLGW